MNQLHQSANELNPYFILLSLPSDIADAVQKALERNQNVQFVNSIKDANMVLYLNYVKDNGNGKPGFVFAYRKPVTEDYNNPGDRTFYKFHIDIASLQLKSATMEDLVNKITAMTLEAARGKGSHWLNEYGRR